MTSQLKFLKGQVLPTFMKGFNDLRAVKIEEILQAKSLEKVFLSAMCVDWDWLLDLIPSTVPIAVVTDYDKKSTKAGVYQGKRDNIRIICPKCPISFGTMHAKLFLLFFDDFLRVGVSSGNLMDYDYDQVQNLVFLQDLPKTAFPETSQFFEKLIEMLTAMSAPSSLKDELKMYNWSAIQAKLVTSVPSWDKPVNGCRLLGELVKPIIDNKQVSAEFQATSFGNFTTKILENFCQEISGKADLDIKLVFPSMQTVNKSKLGADGFGTIFLSPAIYSRPSFPKDKMYDCSARKTGTSMHSKVLTVFDKQTSKPIAFYAGSHNYSISAWGFLTSKGKFQVNNFEAGVLIDGEQANNPPIFYERPMQKYEDELVPWTQ